MIRSVVLDIGETIRDDTRYWNAWADWLHVPHHTLSALVGTVVTHGLDNAEALRLLRPDIDIAEEWAARQAAGMGEVIEEEDLYPDARPALAALRDAGLWVGLAGNQTAEAGRMLADLRLPVHGIATSAEWGAAKPDPQFFRHVTEWAPGQPDEILYVGDHPANDMYPARRAGLRTALIRRGPIGYWWAGRSSIRHHADWVINGLDDLPTITGG